MDNYITVKDLIIVTLLIVCGLCVYLIFAVRNLNESLKTVRTLLKDNKDNIDTVLKKLPNIAENVEKASSVATNELDTVHETLKYINQTAEMTAATAGKIKTDIFESIKGVSGVIGLLGKVLKVVKPKKS